MNTFKLFDNSGHQGEHQLLYRNIYGSPEPIHSIAGPFSSPVFGDFSVSTVNYNF